MILIVTGEQRALFAADLQQMFAQRKRVFIDQLHWKLPLARDLELDAYDRPETIYLLAKTHVSGPLLASARLLPTELPHLMSEVFADACATHVQRGPRVWEASRFCVSTQVQARREGLCLLWQIIAGIMESALLFGRDQVILTANRALLPLVLRCGWDAAILGPTRPDGSDEVTPVGARITPAGLCRVRARFQLEGPVTRLMAAQQAAA